MRLSFSPNLFLRECKCANYAEKFSTSTFTINEYFYGSNSPYYSGYIYQECYSTNHGGNVRCEASKVDDGDNNCIDESDEPGLNDGGNTESSKDLRGATQCKRHTVRTAPKFLTFPTTRTIQK